MHLLQVQSAISRQAGSKRQVGRGGEENRGVLLVLSAVGEAFPSALAEAETRSFEQVKHQFNM